MNRKMLIFVFDLALMGIFLSGCGNAVTPTPTLTPTSIPTLTPTHTQTLTPTQTSTPTIPPTPVGGGGGRIAFYRDGDIYIMDADGSHLTNLTNNPGADLVPAWSPDGKRIAFTSRRDGNGIYVMDADGSHLTRLINYQAYEFVADWSPDGTHILFTSTRDNADPMNCMPCNEEIYVMKVDGSNVTRLTNNPAHDSSPTWSPDGTHIAFSSNRDGNNEIYLMNADGSNVTRLTNDPATDYSPVWSPDGLHIAFSSYRDGNGEIYLMDADGSNVTRLTNNPAYEFVSDWSPDGMHIAFESTRDDPNPTVWPSSILEIYMMDADGSNVIRLTTSSTWNEGPVWQP